LFRYGSVTRGPEEAPAAEQLYGVENVFHMGVLVHQLLQVWSMIVTMAQLSRHVLVSARLTQITLWVVLVQNYQQAMSTVLDVPPPPTEDAPAVVSEAMAVDGEERDPEEGEEGEAEEEEEGEEGTPGD
jgi:hypothetical protein